MSQFSFPVDLPFFEPQLLFCIFYIFPCVKRPCLRILRSIFHLHTINSWSCLFLGGVQAHNDVQRVRLTREISSEGLQDALHHDARSIWDLPSSHPEGTILVQGSSLWTQLHCNWPLHRGDLCISLGHPAIEGSERGRFLEKKVPSLIW